MKKQEQQNANPEKIKDKTLKGRRTGIGITAEGDMLAALGMRYGLRWGD